MKFEELTQEVSQVFNFGITQNKFEDIAKSWIGKNKILAYKVNPNQGNVIVVTHDQSQSLYEKLRFFVGGEKWQVSVDFQQGKSEDIIQHLVEF